MSYAPLVVIVCAVVLAIIVIDLWVIDLPAIAEPLDGKISIAQKEAVTTLITQSRLLITLSLGVIGGCAFLATERFKSNTAFSRSGILALLGTATACVLSIYFGHLLTTVIIEMLANDILEILYWSVVWSYKTQYILLIVSIVVFVFLIYEEFIREK